MAEANIIMFKNWADHNKVPAQLEECMKVGEIEFSYYGPHRFNFIKQQIPSKNCIKKWLEANHPGKDMDYLLLVIGRDEHSFAYKVFLDKGDTIHTLEFDDELADDLVKAYDNRAKLEAATHDLRYNLRTKKYWLNNTRSYVGSYFARSPWFNADGQKLGMSLYQQLNDLLKNMDGYLEEEHSDLLQQYSDAKMNTESYNHGSLAF